MRVIVILANLVFLTLWCATSSAGTKVGSGDEGSDLEGATVLTEGKIVKARDAAVKKLQSLNVSAVPGLGNLIPEVEKSTLYLTKQDAPALLKEDQGQFHVNLNGHVFARTFAEPHAATRFFPASTKLDQDQLIALHIHEGLHRCLPESIREDEATVTKITLAINAPEATYDRVADTMSGYANQMGTRPINDDEFFSGSSLGYGFRYFFEPNQATTYRVRSMHLIQSHLYPFGGVKNRIGFGLDFAGVSTDKGFEMGPVSISVQAKLFQKGGFEFGAWAQGSFNTLSTEELKHSQYGRDLGILGIRIYKPVKRFYVENFVSLSTPGSAKQTLGSVEYQYQYGTVFDIKIRGGAKVSKWDIGAFAELHLADYFKVSGGAFQYDSGRYRVFSAGPEITYRDVEWEASAGARFLLDATKGADFGTLGHLMGPGVSQGSIGTQLKIFF